MSTTDRDEERLAGWATASFDRSVRTVFVWGLAAWQIVAIVAAVVGDSGEAQWPLIVGALVVVVLAVIVNADLLTPWVFVLAVDAMVLSCWLAAGSMDGVLAFAAAWMGNFGYLLPVFALRGRQAKVFAVVILAMGPLGLAVSHPDRFAEMALSTTVTGSAVILVGSRALRFLRSVALRVDAEIVASARSRGAAAVARARAVESAERSRVLHDTVVNTLAAIASGGGATHDVDLVRHRCRGDVVTVEALLGGHELSVDLSALSSIAADVGLDVRRHGLSDAEMARWVETVPQEVLGAMGAAARELVGNVAKHSGVRSVDLTANVADGVMSVTVADDGAGFDLDPVRGRGLAESVYARANAAGIDVSIQTAPGQGTRATLAYRLGPAEFDSAEGSDDDIAETVRTIRRHSAWWWATAVFVVGVAIDLSTRIDDLGFALAMLGTMAFAGAVAWVDSRRGHLGLIGSTVVVATVPVVFVTALGAVGFVRTDGVLWQAIAVTAPLVLLAELAPTGAALAAGCGLLGATAAVTAVRVAADTPEAAVIIAAGTVAALGVIVLWALFQSLMRRLGRLGADEHAARVEANLGQAITEAMTRARESWPRAGLRSSLELLRGLADDSLDPGDAEVRSACADEESHLRQLMALDPELVHLQARLALALNRARVRRVALSIRTGGVDVEEATAASFGDLLVRSVDAVPAGSELTFSLFPFGDRLRLAIVGPSPVLSQVAKTWAVPAEWELSVEAHDDLEAIEVVRQANRSQASSNNPRLESIK